MGLQFRVEIGKGCRHKHVHAPKQMVLGDTIIEPVVAKELALVALLTPHHPHILRRLPRSSNGISVRRPSPALFDSIDQTPKHPAAALAASIESHLTSTQMSRRLRSVTSHSVSQTLMSGSDVIKRNWRIIAFSNERRNTIDWVSEVCMADDTGGSRKTEVGEGLLITRIQAEDFSILARKVPVSAGLQTQIAPGHFWLDTTLVRTPDVVILKCHIATLTLSVTVLDPKYIAVILPLSWNGEYRINSTLVMPTNLFVSSSQDGYYARGDNRDFISIGLCRRRFIDTLAALRGVHPEEVVVNDDVLELPAAAIARLRLHLGSFIDDCMKFSTGALLPMTQVQIENEVFAAVLDAYLYACPTPSHNSQRGPQPERIVRLAEEHFVAAGSAPVSLAGLCAATGVGRNVLYRSFRSLFDETPLRYFHKRRLMQVRSTLLQAQTKHGRVKQAALSAGLTELGRFSVEYRELFGEAPSTTLARSHKLRVF